ncbi:MAG TPA: hypothetical protein V6D18_03310 [Thermosynechococcaceae cyanobacterium]
MDSTVESAFQSSTKPDSYSTLKQFALASAAGWANRAAPDGWIKLKPIDRWL